MNDFKILIPSQQLLILTFRNVISTLVFFAVFGFAIVAGAATPNKSLETIGSTKPSIDSSNDAKCDPMKLSPWPLQPLDKNERYARLSFFLNKYNFVVKVDGTAGKEICSPLLEQLNNLSEVKILERSNSSPRMGCKNIQDMTLYGSYDGKPRPSLLPDDPQKASMSIEEKEANADLFYRRTSDQFTDFYDLSKYFGENSWGILAESVALHYHPRHSQQMCLRKWDAYLRAGTIGRVVNSSSCSAYFLPLLITAQRLAGDGDWHESTPAFSAFIELDDKPYALVFRLGQPWNNFSYIDSPRGGAMPQLILTPLQSPENVTEAVAATSSCLFEVKNTK